MLLFLVVAAMCNSYKNNKKKVTQLLKPILNEMTPLESMERHEVMSRVTREIPSKDTNKYKGEIEAALNALASLQV